MPPLAIGIGAASIVLALALTFPGTVAMTPELVAEFVGAVAQGAAESAVGDLAADFAQDVADRTDGASGSSGRRCIAVTGTR
ncbi:hypothetical protein, partial [Kibdelosporangium aridum]|uniref:hypothetical protein n=1 Tax=Kibdelosporangium aridum TaxID=2030 RepID=UPI001C8C7F3E